MKSVLALIWGTFLFLILGCSGGKHMEMTKAGEFSYQEGDYTKALELSEQIIRERESRGKKASGNIYSLAGASAFELNNYDKSLEYLQKARDYFLKLYKFYQNPEYASYIAKIYTRLDDKEKNNYYKKIAE